jgi:hypothetical protein
VKGGERRVRREKGERRREKGERREERRRERRGRMKIMEIMGRLH